MSRPDLDDLLQGELDGVNSPAESARLREQIASDPDLASRFTSLRAAAETLAGAERLAPPAGFADDVMRSVRNREASRTSRPGWRELLRTLLAPAPLAACAATLVVGVVLGGLLPSDSVFSRSERAALSGTSLTQARLGAPASPERLAFDRDGLRGEAVTRLDEGLVVLELRLDAARPVDVRLDLGGSGLAPRSFAEDGPSGGEVVVSGDAVRFTHPAGRNRYVVGFAPGGSPGSLPRLRVGDGGGLALSFTGPGTP